MKQAKFKQIETGKIPEDWEELILSKVVDINPQRFFNKGVSAKCVSMSDLKEFTKKITDYNVRKYKGGSRFQNNDTLMARITPCLENGKTAFVDFLDTDEIGFGSTEFMILSAKDGKTIPQYVYYLATSPEIRRQAIKSMTGTSGRQRVDYEAFRNITVRLPSIPEQRTIAKILSDLDEKIELNHQMNKTLESVAQAIFKHWFIDFEFPNEEGKPYKSNGGKMANSELGEIPMGWRIGAIKDIVNIQSGFAFKSSCFNDEGQYGLVTIKNVQDGCFVTKCDNRLSETPSEMPKYCFLQNGDIILSLTGNVGRVCLVNGKNYLLNQRVAKLEPRLGDDKAFVYCLFRQPSFKKTLQNIARGTAQSNLSPVETSDLSILVPKSIILGLFEGICGAIVDMAVANNNTAQRLVQIRDSLLPKLLSGKIRLVDSERHSLEE